MASKKTKKKKFRIKKRARRTIGSLLLVTAIIVALIPVNKTEAWVDPAVTTAVPYLDEVIEKHGFIDESETSIVSKTPDDECLMAFPLTDEKLNVVDYNGNTHSYYQINTNGMTAANAVPIFKLGELSSNGGTYTALVKYVGSRNDYNPSAISLAGDVCYNPKDKTLNSYYENAGDGTVNYVTETYTEYTDKLNNTFNILSLTREKLAYDNTDEEQAAWVKANPDPVKSDWKGHFGIDGPPSQVNNLCFEKKGIDYICDEAFKNTTTVNTINIPENLYQIGNSAFEGCYYLQNVTLGSKVSTLGRKCFADCTQLKNINIVNCSSLRTIGDGCFANAAFQSLKLPLSVEKIGAGAFYGCYNLNDSLDIKNGMFGEFENNGASKEIDIGHYLYANCTSLTNMSMYGKLRSVDKSGSVDDTFDGMFAGCNNLVKVELPASYGLNKPVTIGEMMFFGCKNLECLRIPTKHAAANDWQFITNSTLPYAKKAHSGAITTVSDKFVIWGENPYPEAANETDSHLYSKEYSNTYMYLGDDGNYVYELELGGYDFHFTGNTIKNIIPTERAEDSLTIPANIGDSAISDIASNCFDSSSEYADELKKLTIPDTVKTIGNKAFSGLPSLENVYINTTGLDIGSDCFSENHELQYVRFNQTVDGGDTKLGDRCFYNCPELLEVDFRDDAYDSDIIYDVNITSIGVDAFKTNRQSAFNDNDLEAAGLNKLGAKEYYLIMKGNTDVNYKPYYFALNLGGSNNTVSTKYNSYITYISGNPSNIACKYNCDEKKGAIGTTLLTYPTLETMVGKTYDANGNITGDVYIKDIVSRYMANDALQTTEMDIISKLQNINIPEGIEYIDETVNTMDPTADYLRKIYGTVDGKEDGVHSIALNVSELPDEPGIFREDKYLTNVFFNKDIKHMGDMPFEGCDSLSNVAFNAEGNYDDATPENPYYWCENGIVYAYDGTDVTLEEVLPGRGELANISSTIVNGTTDPSIAGVTKIAPGAFKNCDSISRIDLSAAKNLKEIPENCFYGCSELREIALPDAVNYIESGAFIDCDDKIEVIIPGKEVYISDQAFDKQSPTLYSYNDSTVKRYAKEHKYEFIPLNDRFLVTFADYDGTVIKTEYVTEGGDATEPDPAPTRDGYIFTGWKPGYKNITADVTCIAQYEKDTSSDSSSSTNSSSSSSSSSSSTAKGSNSGTGGGSGTGSATSSSSSSSSTVSSNSSTMYSSTVPIVMNGTVTPNGASAGNIASSGGQSSRPNNNSTNKPSTPSGKTTVISTTDGITDVGKMSATVNGSSDNYVVKITETEEASTAAKNALFGAFGSLDNIKYLPIDISLYDSTGNNKISPVPSGVTVSITVPIPDDLAIYGGNAKVASTANNTLEKLTPKFTVINSVPCMTFTANHFSPYVIYVDTANLTATGTLDNTPKTGDFLHPKWFLCIGLIAAALFLFLKKDNEEALLTA